MSFKEQITIARLRQAQRLKQFDISTNAKLSSAQLKQCMNLSQQARHFLVKAGERLGLTARGFYQVLKVALTITDLQELDEIGQKQVAEALSLRQDLS